MKRTKTSTKSNDNPLLCQLCLAKDDLIRITIEKERIINSLLSIPFTKNDKSRICICCTNSLTCFDKFQKNAKTAEKILKDQPAKLDIEFSEMDDSINDAFDTVLNWLTDVNVVLQPLSKRIKTTTKTDPDIHFEHVEVNLEMNVEEDEEIWEVKAEGPEQPTEDFSMNASLSIVDKLSDKVDDVKNHVVLALAMLTELSQKPGKNDHDYFMTKAASEVVLPEAIKTKEELLAFEESLSDKTKFRTVVILLQAKFSSTPHVSVKNMLGVLLSPEITKWYTFAGTKEKAAFTTFKNIRNVVFAAHAHKITEDIYKDGCKLFFKVTSAALKTSTES